MDLADPESELGVWLLHQRSNSAAERSSNPFGHQSDTLPVDNNAAEPKQNGVKNRFNMNDVKR